MRIAVIIVGIGQWEEYTLPLIYSIRNYEQDVEIVFVDNGYKSKYIEHWERMYNFKTVHTEKITSYAEAINNGVFVSDKDSDWNIILNNDVKCTGRFTEKLQKLSNNSLYGNDIHYSNKKFKSFAPWIDGWMYVIPDNVIRTVGDWDENFKIAGFEDADYCLRAYKLGFTTEKCNLPFVHLGEHIRRSMDNYNNIRKENMRYLVEKHGLIWK